MLLKTLLKGKTRLVSIATILVAVALPVSISVGSAYADSFGNYDSSNGDTYDLITNGDTVNGCLDYTDGGGGPNCYFPNFDWSFQSAGGGNYYLLSTAYPSCIGDHNDNSGLANAGLDPCPHPGYGGGWGTNFHYSICSSPVQESAYEFHNNHWNGWLGPQNYSNGTQEFLNKPSAWCFGDDTGV